MFKIQTKTEKQKSKIFYFLVFAFYISLVFGGLFCKAGEQSDKTGTRTETRPGRDVLKGIWDTAKYISIDEIAPGMEAYCLTCFKGTEVEKFTLDVLSVVHNIEPGRDAILVKGTSERFIQTGPVAGCSGSPVYIQGRLAGAIAFAWFFSKDPLYGVTPIKEMLQVGQGTTSNQQPVPGDQPRGGMGFALDFSKPIDFAEINKHLNSRSSTSIQYRASGFGRLPCPLIVSGLSAKTCQQLDALVEPLGLMAVSGSGGSTNVNQAEDVQLAPGAVLTVPLVAGDMTIFVLGTATEVLGDKVYGFGHSFLGYGPVDLPMATGQVHTVVSSLSLSSKLASLGKIVGALTTDESTAVCGRIGAKAQMIPLTIKVDRYNDTQTRLYNCQVANNQLLTPIVLQLAVAGAASYLGDFPPDHMIEYKVAIDAEPAGVISFENVSTGVAVTELIAESIGSVALLMNNPFKKVDIKSLNFDIRILPKNIISHIWSVDLSDSKVKAGGEVKVSVVVESFLAEKKKYQFSLKIPEQTNPGRYDLMVLGSSEYEQYLRKAVPYRFMAQDLTSLIKALNDALSIERDKLYCLLVLPPGGVAVERAELPDLPATKTLLLQNAKRALITQPYPHWLEKSTRTDTVVVDKKIMHITVEK